MKRSSSFVGMFLLAMVVVLAPRAHAEKQQRSAPQRAAATPPRIRGQVSVFGTASPSPQQEQLARATGFFLAKRGYIVLNGGHGGVMEEVSKGARWGGGFVIGIMPSGKRGTANKYVNLEIPTGLGELRNTVLAAAGDAAIAIGTTRGTTSEVAWALRQGKTVVAPTKGVQPFDSVTFVDAPKGGSEFMRIAKQGRAMADRIVEELNPRPARTKTKASK